MRDWWDLVRGIYKSDIAFATLEGIERKCELRNQPNVVENPYFRIMVYALVEANWRPEWWVNRK